MACAPPPTASVEVYDPATGKFTPAGALAKPRFSAVGLLLDDGRVLVHSRYLPEPMEIYDPARETSAILQLPHGLETLPSQATVVKLADGEVLIAGGRYGTDSVASKATLLLDPRSGTFRDGPRMATARQAATATLLDDGRVLIAGGDQDDYAFGLAMSNAESYSPSSQGAAASVLPLQHRVQSSTLLADGRVLVSEWRRSETACPAEGFGEVFDPATERFSLVGRMTTARDRSIAVRSRDGRVLFLGGLDSECRPTRSVEAFDPGSGRFQVVATGFPPIVEFTATELTDGRILIAGGFDLTSDWGLTAETWLLMP